MDEMSRIDERSNEKGLSIAIQEGIDDRVKKGIQNQPFEVHVQPITIPQTTNHSFLSPSLELDNTIR